MLVKRNDPLAVGRLGRTRDTHVARYVINQARARQVCGLALDRKNVDDLKLRLIFLFGPIDSNRED